MAMRRPPRASRSILTVYHLVSDRVADRAVASAGAGPIRLDTRERVLDAALAPSAPGATRPRRSTPWPPSSASASRRSSTTSPPRSLLLEAVIDRAGADLPAVIEDALAGAGPGWARVEAIVRSVFRLAGRRPELLGLLREVSGWGRRRPPGCGSGSSRSSSGRPASSTPRWTPGAMRRQDARLLLLATYSTVIGMATEVEVLRALGLEPTARSLVRRRAELLAFLRSALAVGPPEHAG